MTGEHRNWPKLWIRIPPDLKRWLEEESDRNFGSQNSEVVRALRERMERQTKAAPESAGTLAEA
jgi:hypothetical protein